MLLTSQIGRTIINVSLEFDWVADVTISAPFSCSERFRPTAHLLYATQSRQSLKTNMRMLGFENMMIFEPISDLQTYSFPRAKLERTIRLAFFLKRK